MCQPFLVIFFSDRVLNDYVSKTKIYYQPLQANRQKHQHMYPSHLATYTPESESYTAYHVM